MRTRRYANNERIRSKERRLLEVLRRLDSATLWGTFPPGVIGTLQYLATASTHVVTVYAPLAAVVPTSAEQWVVDQDPTPSPTGGFADVTIPAACQVADLLQTTNVSLTGQPSGTYTLYAAHQVADENPETRNPPGKYASGGGVFTEHRAFFGYVHSDGEPIPREEYDASLAPVAVSELRDRIILGFVSGTSWPANTAPLLRIAYSQTSGIQSATPIYRTISLSAMFDHIGRGGVAAHPDATTAESGFMSAADKLILQNLGTAVSGHNHDDRYVRYDAAQSLSAPQQAQARGNISAAPSNHDHNTLYYTKGQADTLLSNKLGVSAKAADSDLLDGLNSTAFLRSNASTSFTSGTLTMAANTTMDFSNSATLKIPVK